MSALLQVMTTLPSQQQAQSLARAIVQRRLAACVQVLGPIESVYWWQGQIDSATEWQLLAKTTHDQYPPLEQAIAELHPYDTPEIIALPIAASSHRYLQWLQTEVQTRVDP